MLSIAVVAAAIAARRGSFEPAATEHGGATRMAVAGDFLVLRARRGCGSDQIGAISGKGKRQFCLYFFNRLEGIFGILLNPKFIFTKTKNRCLYSLVRTSRSFSLLHLFFIAQPPSLLHLKVCFHNPFYFCFSLLSSQLIIPLSSTLLSSLISTSLFLFVSFSNFFLKKLLLLSSIVLFFF
jgi:hypothetical protein